MDGHGTGLVFHQERKRSRIESLEKNQELEGLLSAVDDDPEEPLDSVISEPENAPVAE